MTIDISEKAFENAIEAALLEGGYEEGERENYDKKRALDTVLVLRFIKDSQQEKYKQLQEIKQRNEEEVNYFKEQLKINQENLDEPVVEQEIEAGQEAIDDSSPSPEVTIPPAPTPPHSPIAQTPEEPVVALPPPPAPAPVTAMPPPPAPAPVAAMPPPQNTALPPPPSAGLPPPLPVPEPSNMIGQNPFNNQTPQEPSSFPVQAAPREELLSSEEANDLLDDLNG